MAPNSTGHFTTRARERKTLPRLSSKIMDGQLQRNKWEFETLNLSKQHRTGDWHFIESNNWPADETCSKSSEAMIGRTVKRGEIDVWMEIDE